VERPIKASAWKEEEKVELTRNHLNKRISLTSDLEMCEARSLFLRQNAISVADFM
jgi:hypothetical protein